VVRVEGEGAGRGRPLDGARVGAEEDHVVAAVARHGDVDAAHLHGLRRPVLLVAGEVLARALEGAGGGLQDHGADVDPRAASRRRGRRRRERGGGRRRGRGGGGGGLGRGRGRRGRGRGGRGGGGPGAQVEAGA